MHPARGRRISAYDVEVVARIQSRVNDLAVDKIGSRLALVNGIHRAAALMRVGFDRIPRLLGQFGSLADVFPSGALGMIPEARLMSDERLPYLADDCDPQAAPHFHQRRMSIVRITPRVEVMYVAKR